MINEYVKRKVAVRDTQGCVLCHKPSTTVLFNKSGPDWFYTCDLHLQDNPQFAVPVYGAEYESVVEKMKETKRQLSIQAQSKGGLGNWDGWVNKFISTTKSKKEDSKEDSKEEESKEDKKEDAAPLNLQKEYDQLLDRLTELRKTNKRYKLSDIMFQNRVDLKERQRIKEIKIKKMQEQYSNTDPTELTSKFDFPSVPTEKKL